MTIFQPKYGQEWVIWGVNIQNFPGENVRLLKVFVFNQFDKSSLNTSILGFYTLGTNNLLKIRHVMSSVYMSSTIRQSISDKHRCWLSWLWYCMFNTLKKKQITHFKTTCSFFLWRTFVWEHIDLCHVFTCYENNNHMLKSGQLS